jgi:hypothetical protein
MVWFVSTKELLQATLTHSYAKKGKIINLKNPTPSHTMFGRKKLGQERKGAEDVCFLIRLFGRRWGMKARRKENINSRKEVVENNFFKIKLPLYPCFIAKMTFINDKFVILVSFPSHFLSPN